MLRRKSCKTCIVSHKAPSKLQGKQQLQKCSNQVWICCDTCRTTSHSVSEMECKWPKGAVRDVCSWVCAIRQSAPWVQNPRRKVCGTAVDILGKVWISPNNKEDNRSDQTAQKLTLNGATTLKIIFHQKAPNISNQKHSKSQQSKHTKCLYLKLTEEWKNITCISPVERDVISPWAQAQSMWIPAATVDNRAPPGQLHCASGARETGSLSYYTLRLQKENVFICPMPVFGWCCLWLWVWSHSRAHSNVHLMFWLALKGWCVAFPNWDPIMALWVTLGGFRTWVASAPLM